MKQRQVPSKNIITIKLPHGSKIILDLSKKYDKMRAISDTSRIYKKNGFSKKCV